MSSQLINNLCVSGCFECATGSHFVNYTENDVEILGTPGELHLHFQIPSIVITPVPSTGPSFHPSPYCPSSMDCVMCYLDTSVQHTDDERLSPPSSPEDVQENHPELFRSHSSRVLFNDMVFDAYQFLESDEQQEPNLSINQQLADSEADFDSDDFTDEGYYSDDESLDSFESDESSDSAIDYPEWPQSPLWVPLLTGGRQTIPTITCPEGSNCFACLTMRLSRQDSVDPNCNGDYFCVCTNCNKTTFDLVKANESWFDNYFLEILSRYYPDDHPLAGLLSIWEQHLQQCAELDARIAEEERIWLLEQEREV